MYLSKCLNSIIILLLLCIQSGLTWQTYVFQIILMLCCFLSKITIIFNKELLKYATKNHMPKIQMNYIIILISKTDSALVDARVRYFSISIGCSSNHSCFRKNDLCNACQIAHTPFKHPGSVDSSQCARLVGTHQHPAIPNFDLKIEGHPIGFETGYL